MHTDNVSTPGAQGVAVRVGLILARGMANGGREGGA